MKNAEFVALLMANSNKTRNIRTYGKKWFSGARRINDSVLCKIGHVIALIQANINEGKILHDRNKEALLVYNFQPLCFHNEEEGSFYLTLDMMVKPIEYLNDTHNLVGTPLQLVVEAVAGEVMNNTKAMLQLGLIISDDLDEDEIPESYGSFKTFYAVCGFVALISESPFCPDDIFSGRIDDSEIARNCVAFDSITEASSYIKEQGSPYAWMAELTVAKEFLPSLIITGISKHALKVISHVSVEVTPHPACSEMEARIEDELKYLWMAISEPALSDEEQVPHPEGL